MHFSKHHSEGEQQLATKNIIPQNDIPTPPPAPKLVAVDKRPDFTPNTDDLSDFHEVLVELLTREKLSKKPAVSQAPKKSELLGSSERRISVFTATSKKCIIDNKLPLFLMAKRHTKAPLLKFMHFQPHQRDILLR